MSTSPQRGRFAPSPSGRLHGGNLLAFLLAWLSARSQNGEIVLRMEDLDQQRCSPAQAELIREDLSWLGLDWDYESPPQSQRAPAYGQALAALRQQGLVYPCWCSRGQLRAGSAPHAGDGHAVYSGRCRRLSPQQRAAQKGPASQRLLVPAEMIGLYDRVQGWYGENLAHDCGDFVLQKADGGFAYQLAVVVDDGESGVTQVVRGRDLLSSVPRQLYLYRLLGLTPPQYYHIPLLLAPGGRRLSKRDRDLDAGRLRLQYRPQQLLGRLAQSCGLLEQAEPVELTELLSLFDWAKVKREDATLEL